MPAPNYTISLVASPIGGTTGLTPGDAMVHDPTSNSYVLATSENRGSKRSSGIAIGHAAVNGATLMQTVGDVPPALTGLAAGSASWVRVAATGRLERCSPAPGDDVVGFVEDDGTLHLCCGFLTAAMISGGGGITPSGTGVPHVFGGVMLPMASPIDLASDYDVMNQLPFPRLAGQGTGVLHSAAGIMIITPVVDADVSLSAAIDGKKIVPNFGSQTVISDTIIKAGTGSNYACMMQPLVGYTTTNGAIYFLTQATVPNSANCSLYGDGSASFLNAPGSTSYAGLSQAGGNATFRAYATRNESGVPLIGNTNMSSPYGVHGEGTVDMNNANVTLAAAVYVYGAIKVTSTTAFTAARTLTFPAPASDAVAYQKWVRNTQSGAFAVTLSTGTGTTQTVAQGKVALFLFDSSGVVRLTPDT